MGYVTELELELAKKCITAGKIEINQQAEDYEVKTIRAIYGLYWLGYMTSNGNSIEGLSRSSTEIKKCSN